MDGPIIRSLSALSQQAPAPFVLYIDGNDVATVYVYQSSSGRYCRIESPSCGNFTFNGTNMPLSARVFDGRAYMCCDTTGPVPGPSPDPDPATYTANRVMITDSAGEAIGSPDWYHMPNVLWRGPQPKIPTSSNPARLMISNASTITQINDDPTRYNALINGSSFVNSAALVGVFDDITGNTNGSANLNSTIALVTNMKFNDINSGLIVVGGHSSSITSSTLSTIMARNSNFNEFMSSIGIVNDSTLPATQYVNVIGNNIDITGRMERTNVFGLNFNGSGQVINSSIIGRSGSVNGNLTNVLAFANATNLGQSTNSVINSAPVSSSSAMIISADNSIISSTSRRAISAVDSVVVRVDNGTIGPPDNPHTYLNVVEVGSLDVNNPSKTNMVTIMNSIVLGRTALNPVDPLDENDYVTMNDVTSIGYGNEIIGDSNSSTILGRNVTLDRLPHTMVLKADDTPITYTLGPDRSYMTNIFASDGISAVNTMNQQIWSNLLPETVTINIRAATSGAFVPSNFYSTMRAQQLTASNNYLHVNASAFGVASVPAPDTVDLRGQISVLMGTVKEMADIIATLDARITALGG